MRKEDKEKMLAQHDFNELRDPAGELRKMVEVARKNSVAKRYADAIPQVIDQEHMKAHKAALNAIQHAVVCGIWLAAAKEKAGHGGWLKWIDNNTRLRPRQVQKYMRLAERADELVERLANTHSDAYLGSIDEAMALLAEPAEKRETAEPEAELEAVAEPASNVVEMPGAKAPPPPAEPSEPPSEPASIEEARDYLREAGEEQVREVRRQMLAEALKTFSRTDVDSRRAFLKGLARRLDPSERELLKRSLAQRAA